MNYSTAIFVISDEARCLRVRYDPKKDGTQQTKEDMLVKTLDQTINVGDLVLVQSGTRYGLTVAKVKEVDIEPDLTTREVMNWAIGGLNRDGLLSNFAELERQELAAIEAIKRAERRKKREEIRKAIFDDKSREEIKALPVSTINGDHVVQAAPKPEAAPAPKPEPWDGDTPI